MRYSIVELTHFFIEKHVSKGAFCIDATAGNGHDTVFLAKLVGSTGMVISMDIQDMAVSNTKENVKKNGMESWVQVVCDSHANMQKYAKENTVECVVFNLGYLPGGNHQLATKAESSIEAMEQALFLLKKDGLLSVTIYSGGDSGFEERDAVLEWLKNLDSKKYLVLFSSFYNRPNNPPIPVQVIKLK